MNINNNLTPIEKLRMFYTQKVLPLVYDYSLSFYEILCKTTDKLNEVVDRQNDVTDATAEALEEIATYSDRITAVETKNAQQDVGIRNANETANEARTEVNRVEGIANTAYETAESVRGIADDAKAEADSVNRQFNSFTEYIYPKLDTMEGEISDNREAVSNCVINAKFTLRDNRIVYQDNLVVDFAFLLNMFKGRKHRMTLRRDGEDAEFIANATDDTAVWFSLFYEESKKIYCERIIINSNNEIKDTYTELGQSDVVTYHVGDVPEHTYLIYKGARISESDAYSIFLSNPFAIIYDEVNYNYYQLINRDSILTFNCVLRDSINIIELSRVAIQSYSIPLGGGDVTDVQINGTSILDEDGVANIKSNEAFGIGYNVNGFYTASATSTQITGRNNSNRPIVSTNYDLAVKAAMCDGVGPAWTETEKASARERMGITSGGISYSTVSHVIGKWIDGRDLYEKTFTWEGDYGEGSVQTLINEPNLDYIVDIRGACRERGDTGNFWPVPWGGTQSWGVNANVTWGNPEQRAVRVVFSGDWGGSRGISKVHVSIQFVKTET